MAFLLFAIKIAQVKLLQSQNAQFDLDNKELVNEFSHYFQSEDEPHVIDYGALSDFGVFQQGILERIDDMCLWHLVILLLAFVLCRKAYLALPPRTAQVLKTLPFSTPGARCICWVWTAFSIWLYIFHISQNFGEIHGTFFVTTEIASIRYLQFLEGATHIATNIIAYSVVPFLFRLVGQVFDDLKDDSALIPSAGKIVNIALFPISIGLLGLCGLLNAVARGRSDSMFSLIKIEEVLILTGIWAAPYIIVSVLAWCRVPPQYSLEVKPLNLFWWINVSKRAL